jgi:ring-1,2-phenylacetyl-CoA epoxidase subunit PaaD
MSTQAQHTVESITRLLHQVKDPEIPTISLIDLGVITHIVVDDSSGVYIKMTPTFAGCPAMDYMKNNVEEVLAENGIADFKVEMNFDTQWSSNNITQDGLEALKKHGLAPPPKHNLIIDIDLLDKAKCPFCESTDTTLKSPFGPTLCRSLHYCHSCSQAFEQFKPV